MFPLDTISGLFHANYRHLLGLWQTIETTLTLRLGRDISRQMNEAIVAAAPLPQPGPEGTSTGQDGNFPPEETTAIFPAWKSIVSTLGVVGKQVHDARLVAVCHARGVTHLLTFNGAHFARLAGVGPGLMVVVDPADV